MTDGVGNSGQNATTMRIVGELYFHSQQEVVMAIRANFTGI